MALAVLIVFFVVFFPNIVPATVTASQARWAHSNAWMDSLSWLKENTPDPFDNPDAYYELHELPPPGESYEYPESAYGVLAWWDYGYWITRIAHRIPSANPSQHPVAVANVARIFTSQDENSANEIVKEIGASYVILDYQTVTGKFHAVAAWAGSSLEEFFEITWQNDYGLIITCSPRFQGQMKEYTKIEVCFTVYQDLDDNGWFSPL